ncbi:MAG: HAMP domain-containing histidine kinase [Bacteroidetes bacterium]|nr:HAMP domain-containing histidine kinase [Bacteroidota bacterium]
MNIYTRKKRWKLILFALAVAIVTASLWYTNILVRKISRDERSNIQIWANAIQQKADLVNYTDVFFKQIKVEERKRAEILADAYTNIKNEDDLDSEDLDFYFKLITGNTTIPVILTDKYDTITTARNVDDINFDGVYKLQGKLKEEFTVFEPIRLNYYADEFVILYFKESKIFTELRRVLDNLIESFFSEIVRNSASVPVIITDSTMQNIIEYGNISPEKINDSVYISKTIAEMEAENAPIEIELVGQGKKYIFYKDSALLTQLFYYPYIQFGIIGLFLMIAYFLFSTARRSEQNQVWVGMSKEAAHQLGTPLSSIMAWLELLKMKELHGKELNEIEKDVKRLENITERFSKIGSTPKLEPVNIVRVINDGMKYIKTRSSSKIKYMVNKTGESEIMVPLNINLFEWVIENICKNAMDAMGGAGQITVNITGDEKYVHIDFRDTGKGIYKSKFKTIFNPGYTSKKRGWGLGLSLSKRIIRDYHKGKIFVKTSTIDKGTTIRVSLRKKF